MTELLTGAQMRAVEHAAIESGAVTGLELMERAGAGVVKAVFEEWRDVEQGAHRAVVLCGPGNNGGDGFVVARLIKSAGWDVEVFLYGDADRLPPDAKVNHQRWAAMGDVHALTQAGLIQAFQRAAQRRCTLVPVIDALFGIGQRRPMDTVLAPVNAMIDALFNGQAGNVAPFFVTVDIPTGYGADTGEALATRPLPSDLIVTFHTRKPLHSMPHMCDPKCIVVDIGLAPFSVSRKSPPEA